MKKTRIIAESGILAALSVIILLIGSLTEALDLSSAVLSGIAVLAMRVRWGRKGAIALYGTTSLLAFLLLPNKIPALLYIFYGGVYPLFKAEIEKIGKTALMWTLKLVCICGMYAAGLFTSKFLMGLDGLEFTNSPWMYALVAAIAVSADVCMSMIIRQYGYVVARKK